MLISYSNIFPSCLTSGIELWRPICSTSRGIGSARRRTISATITPWRKILLRLSRADFVHILMEMLITGKSRIHTRMIQRESHFLLRSESAWKPPRTNANHQTKSSSSWTMSTSQYTTPRQTPNFSIQIMKDQCLMLSMANFSLSWTSIWITITFCVWMQ